MLYYSKNGKSKIVHFVSCRHGKAMLLQNLGSFNTLAEAKRAGYRLCKHCDPLARFYRCESKNVSKFCKSHHMSQRLQGGAICLNTPYSGWQLVCGDEGEILLYHRNRWELKRDSKSAVKGFHHQNMQCDSLLEYCEYIVKHDKYRRENPEKKPPKWEHKPPKKGTNAWRSAQKREAKRDRRRAIDNVFHLFAQLEAARA